MTRWEMSCGNFECGVMSRGDCHRCVFDVDPIIRCCVKNTVMRSLNLLTQFMTEFDLIVNTENSVMSLTIAFI